MSELNYKELQERGVFDVPYKAFQFMQNQQAKIDAVKLKSDEIINVLNEKFQDISDQDKEIICDYIDEIQELLKWTSKNSS